MKHMWSNKVILSADVRGPTPVPNTPSDPNPTVHGAEPGILPAKLRLFVHLRCLITFVMDARQDLLSTQFLIEPGGSSDG
jgi:hypothetical protein